MAGTKKTGGQTTLESARQNNSVVASRILHEEHQDHSTRAPLFKLLESALGRPVVSYFTSFDPQQQAGMDDTDADMLEGVLQKSDLSAGLALMISSPGGDGLSAERIVNLCRKYSGTGEYWSIVPGKAKSAATMVCLGSSRIIMGPSSELGPIDPQVLQFNSQTHMARYYSAYYLLESYRTLLNDASETKGHLEPFLQLLMNYDTRDVREWQALIDLSTDIAIRMLASGMLKSCSETEIKKKILVFLTPERTKTHGRPIYSDEAMSCCLNVTVEKIHSALWHNVYELYMRSSHYVMTHVAKCIESETESFIIAAKRRVDHGD